MKSFVNLSTTSVTSIAHNAVPNTAVNVDNPAAVAISENFFVKLFFYMVPVSIFPKYFSVNPPIITATVSNSNSPRNSPAFSKMLDHDTV